ncbi:hypothetical protein LUW77_13395 [Streptomyces radiopugnans]|nr:hypothetical protein LUW77_13395 [Streptomyces radiopugnans]
MTGPHGTKAAGEAVGAEGAAAGPPTRMAGHLRLPGAVALAITIVVGSGALVSPGIAYHQTGQAALYAWLVAAAVTVPLLIVFARLGADLPGAGGVARLRPGRVRPLLGGRRGGHAPGHLRPRHPGHRPDRGLLLPADPRSARGPGLGGGDRAAGPG